MGSLIEAGRDNSGQMYRRNRYYDPATGRFTQEDPIGLAGGLNLYGFAGGDPVNFTDPFGLCPEWLDEIPCVDVIASPMRPANASTGSGVNGSWYGRTRFNQDGTPGKWHGGFDWAGAEGTAVVAPGDATVTYGEGEDSGLYAYMNLGNGATVSVSHLAADDET
jgi:RHS repeat-associated protein